MGKTSKKVGTGQLWLQIALPWEAKEGTEETGVNGSTASTGSSTPRSPSKRRKWYSLIDKVYALPNLRKAWARVAANRGAAGVDGMTVQRFAEGVEERLTALAQDLRQKTYRPQPVRRVFLPKPGGGRRPLGIPTVRDRIVQQALRQVLEPIFEAKFSRRSHGFRPERGCATALQVVDAALRHGYSWVVDADLQAFFDRVDHEKLVAALNEEVADGSVLKLVTRILRAGVELPASSEVEPTELGTPQGGPLSPLLANVYLDAFDKKMDEAGYGLVRYADDVVLFAQSREAAEAALSLAREVLEGQWGLTLHPEKTRVVSVDEGFEFLGFHYFRDPQRGVLRKEVRARSARHFREHVRRLTPRLRNQRKPKRRHLSYRRLAGNPRLAQMVEELNRFLRGWHWYFKGLWSPYPDPFDSADQYVRRRLRSALVGRTGNGWWTVLLTNRLLARLGLVSLHHWHQQYLSGFLEAPVRKD